MNENLRLEWLEYNLLQRLHEAKMRHIEQGRELFDLSMINPDIAPPRILLDKLMEASGKVANHRYSVSKGIKKLRQAFAEKYKSKFGIKLDADKNVCVTMGTKDALVNSLVVAAGPGEKILLSKPSYPAHVSACRMAGLEPVFFELSAKPQEMLTEISSVLEKERCKIILINFPNNPCGLTVERNFYEDLIKIASNYSALIINDFVYGEMRYDGNSSVSLLSVYNTYDNLLESYSLSKAYSVPGWRIGAVLGNEKLIERLARLKSHIDYGIFLPLQIAASSALTSSTDIVKPTVEEYKRRARFISSGLKNIGWQVHEPEAGTIVWAKMPESIKAQYQDSLKFAEDFLVEEGVLVSPGSIYGENYHEYIRFALVASNEKLYEALRRLERFQNKLLNPEHNRAVSGGT